MNKLTKDQAEYLTERLKKHTRINLLVDKDFIIKEHRSVCEQVLFDIINECTEKKCPVFRMEAEGGSFEAFQNSSNKIAIGISYTNVSNAVALLELDFKQFKELVVGVAAIDKWLEGKND